MNILIPHKWLLEHLQTNANPQSIGEKLSLCGPTVERINRFKGDDVYDIEVTTNRVDCMSVYGIARELSVILPEFGIKAGLTKLSLPEITEKKKLDLEIRDDQKFCRRILAVKLENLFLQPSPQWLQDRLEQVGQRPLNNVIDITNYVMWEIGHPLHVFDYDRLVTKKIHVREAKKGETIVTLDDKQHTLQGGEVVFDNSKGAIIDLPGIMGTKNTVVTESTKNVLLWIESIDAVKIRQASMNLAIRSQAAVLNEKHVDPNLGLATLLRAVYFYRKLASATTASELLDIYPHPEKPSPVKLEQKSLDRYLGVSIKPQRVSKILQTLGCTVISSGQSYQITPPSWRQEDLKIEPDFIEEIARIYGYHNLESKLMDTAIPDHPSPDDFQYEFQLKAWLSGWGLQEIYTYSMISRDLALKSGYSLDKHLKIKNPLLDNWTYLRRSLIPSLVEVVENNQLPELSVFELQNVYHPNKIVTKLPHEELQLAVVTTKNYLLLKGILDALGKKLFITNLRVEPEEIKTDFFNPLKSATVSSNGTLLGYLGEINHSRLCAFVLKLDKLRSVSSKYPKSLSLVKTPPIIEDLTFSLPEKTYSGYLLEEIKLVSLLVENAELADFFRPDQEKIHLTFRITYRHPDRPLTDSEIAPVRKKIAQILQKNFRASLVGEV